jgi:hypothetical protein
MTNLTKLREDGDNELPLILFSSICIRGEDGLCDRSQEHKLTVDNTCISDYIHQREDKAYQLGQQDMLERVRGVIKYERSTWAKESIGDKALQSLEMAVETLKALDNLN